MSPKRLQSGASPSDFAKYEQSAATFTALGAGVLGQASLFHPAPPIDQRDVPCCISICITTAMEILDNADSSSLLLSPLYHYYITRPDPVNLPNLDFDRGLLTASVSGIARLSLHDPPMSLAGARMTPSAAAFADGAQHTLGGGIGPNRFGYRRVYSGTEIAEWRAALSSGAPIVIAFWLSKGYGAITAQMPIHGSNLTGAGKDGHAVVVVGYDDAEAAFIIRDSRGPTFADRGHWLLPYGLVNPALIIESWAVTNITYNT